MPQLARSGLEKFGQVDRKIKGDMTEGTFGKVAHRGVTKTVGIKEGGWEEGNRGAGMYVDCECEPGAAVS